SLPHAAGGAQGAQSAGLPRAYRALPGRAAGCLRGGARGERRTQRRPRFRLGMTAVADRRSSASDRDLARRKAAAPRSEGTPERRAGTTAGSTQPTLRRMRRFGVRPDRDLGQSFLIDSNILGVIERAAELAPDDVVLEIGGGLGVLSEHLAERVGYVH